MVRERHEHGAVDARPLHLGEQLLGRRLGLRREELVHVAREALGDGREDVRVRVDDRHAASTYRRAASAYSSAACRIPATGALSFGACARGQEARAERGDRRDPGRELEMRRVGRAGEDADGALVAEHDPARLAQRRDERDAPASISVAGMPDLEVELGVELRIVGRRVARGTLSRSSTSCSRVMPGSVRMSQANSASPG